MTIETTGRKLKILAWPAFSNKASNPYQYNLYTGMAESADVDEMTFQRQQFREILRQKYDVFHVHWLDKALWSRSNAAAVRHMLGMAYLVRRLAAKGTHIVWTVHDPAPHTISVNRFMHTRFGGLVWNFYLRAMIRSISGLFFLSREHIADVVTRYPRFGDLPRTIVPHPHYIGSYPDHASRAEARGRLGIDADAPTISFVGKLRPYKNVEALIEAFRAWSAPDARLVVAGEPDSPDYEAALRRMVDGDRRIRLDARFVPDDELQYFTNAADVIVLPFKKATNSGSVALSLSFARPTAVPDIPVFREVRDIVGAEWLYLFEGELTADTLGKIVAWAKQTPRAERPPLDRLSWESIVKRTLDFYTAGKSDRS